MLEAEGQHGQEKQPGRIRRFVSALGNLFTPKTEQTLSLDPFKEIDELAKKLRGKDPPVEKYLAASRMAVVLRQLATPQPKTSS